MRSAPFLAFGIATALGCSSSGSIGDGSGGATTPPASGTGTSSGGSPAGGSSSGAAAMPIADATAGALSDAEVTLDVGPAEDAAMSEMDGFPAGAGDAPSTSTGP